MLVGASGSLWVSVASRVQKGGARKESNTKRGMGEGGKMENGKHTMADP